MAQGVVSANGAPEISCVLATDCLGVVGSPGRDGFPAVPTHVARWNGSSWRRVAVTLPKGARLVDLTAVSCQGAKSCLVVGDYFKGSSASGSSYPLALAYNGTSVKPTAAQPLPEGQPDIVLSGVSCVTSRSCVAVGAANGAPIGVSPHATALVETWNGAQWSLHTIPSSAKGLNAPAGVSCVTASFCVVTGESKSGALYIGR